MYIFNKQTNKKGFESLQTWLFLLEQASLFEMICNVFFSFNSTTIKEKNMSGSYYSGGGINQTYVNPENIALAEEQLNNVADLFNR
jgi:hypothetical protein